MTRCGQLTQSDYLNQASYGIREFDREFNNNLLNHKDINIACGYPQHCLNIVQQKTKISKPTFHASNLANRGYQTDIEPQPPNKQRSPLTTIES